MAKKLFLYLIIVIFSAGPAAQPPLYADDRIDRMKEKIEEEEERKREEHERDDDRREDDDEDEDDDGSCLGNAMSGCLGSMFSAAPSSEEEDEEGDSEKKPVRPDTPPPDSSADDTGTTGCILGFFSVFTDVRFAAYPYDPACTFAFVGSVKNCPKNDKFGFLQLDLEGAYLFQDTFGLTAKAGFNFSLLRMQCFYQHVFSATGDFDIFSANGGFTLPLGNGMLHLFAGFFMLDMIEEPLFSFGGELTYFFPANLVMDIYSLNAFYGALGFFSFSCSLSYALGNFSLGIGFNYNYYAEEVFLGPMVKLTLWL